jgi:hypothetical protein
MDERQIRLVVVARQFLDRARVVGEDRTEPGRMAAVVLADLAVEMAAKAAVLDQALPSNARLNRDPSLPVVLEALTGLLQKREGTKEDVPEIRAAGRLHDLRNNVQHRGLDPSAEQVRESAVDSRRFIAWVATNWFGVPLDAVSRAGLIENDAVRKLVQEAERLAAEEDYSRAAERLAVAFEMARQEFRAERREGHYFRPVRATDVGAALADVKRETGDKSAGLAYRKLADFLGGMADQLERLTDQVEAFTLGARASDYVWFKRNFPEVYGIMREGVTQLSATARRDITPAVYLRGLEFVTATAVHWQDFPRLGNPFAEPEDA